MLGRLTDEFDAEDLAWYQEQDPEVADLVRKIRFQEEEITRSLDLHEREILKLRNRLNGRLPMAYLPDDVLVKIFHEIITGRHQDYWDWYHRNGGDNLMSLRMSHGPKGMSDDARSSPVMLVCRRWRDLVLQHPHLWSFLTSIDHPDYVNLAITRSASADLSLRLMTPQQKGHAESFNRLTKELSRATYLAYTSILASTHHWNWVGAELPPSLTAHRVQIIHYHRTRDYSGADQQVEIDPLMKVMEGLAIPDLRTIVLVWPSSRDCTSLIRPTITDLEIRAEGGGDDPDRGIHLGIGFILDLLSGLPLLTRLCLRCPQAYNPPGGELVHVSLDHLRDLDINFKEAICTYFLNSLSFLSHTSVAIAVAVEEEETDTGGAKLAERLKVLCFADRPSPCRLAVKTERKSEITIRLSSSRSPLRVIDELFSLKVTSQSRHHIRPSTSLRYLDTILSNLPLEDVDTIDFQGRDYSHEIVSKWISIFGVSTGEVPPCRWVNMVKSTTITVSGMDLSRYIQFGSIAPLQVGRGPTKQDSGSSPGVPFPHLRRLELSNLRAPYGGYMEHISNVFCSLSENRKTLGIPISEIVWDQEEDGRASYFPEEVENLRSRLIELGVGPTINVPLRTAEGDA